ncbi:LamG domain-containing protein [Candidatus Nanosalina sp. VS9-1]|uniref:LamG domain-containing protein n=1 Tax=Candidatus Nanosalina sp. VS9-1 TaxID=3388566 RepID=UPI0039E01A1B
MPKLSWSSDDFRDSQDSSGTTTEKISGGGLEQGYFHGSLTQGLKAYYTFDSGSGSTAIDEALKNDGTVNGASWSTGKIDGGLDFSGGNYYVGAPSLGDTLSGASGGFTVSAWVNFASFGNNWYPVLWLEAGYNVRLREDDGSRRSDGNRGFGLHINDGGSWTWDASVPTSNLSTGTWHHFVGVYNDSSNTAKFYVDGVKQGEQSTGRPSANSGQNSFMAEAENDRRYRDGKLDEVRIYDRPLSEPEIKALYSLTVPSNVSPGDTVV